jgi:hypothetical protein
MLNLQNNNVVSSNQILGSSTLSIILPTQYDTPIYQSPADIRDIILKGIRAEMVVFSIIMIVGRLLPIISKRSGKGR